MVGIYFLKDIFLLRMSHILRKFSRRYGESITQYFDCSSLPNPYMTIKPNFNNLIYLSFQRWIADKKSTMCASTIMSAISSTQQQQQLQQQQQQQQQSTTEMAAKKERDARRDAEREIFKQKQLSVACLGTSKEDELILKSLLGLNTPKSQSKSHADENNRQRSGSAGKTPDQNKCFSNKVSQEFHDASRCKPHSTSLNGGQSNHQTKWKIGDERCFVNTDNNNNNINNRNNHNNNNNNGNNYNHSNNNHNNYHNSNHNNNHNNHNSNHNNHNSNHNNNTIIISPMTNGNVHLSSNNNNKKMKKYRGNHNLPESSSFFSKNSPINLLTTPTNKNNNSNNSHNNNKPTTNSNNNKGSNSCGVSSNKSDSSNSYCNSSNSYADCWNSFGDGLSGEDGNGLKSDSEELFNFCSSAFVGFKLDHGEIISALRSVVA